VVALSSGRWYMILATAESAVYVGVGVMLGVLLLFAVGVVWSDLTR
jgi:hypothetical protein